MDRPLRFLALCVGPVLHAGKAAVAKYALRNYRTWMLAVSYAFSFGVELTVNNIIVGYISGQRHVHADKWPSAGVLSIQMPR